MKEKIINELKTNIGTYVSGEQLSRKFNVSRMAINKNITKLREEGYHIEAVSQKGYMLIEDREVYNAFEIGYDNKNEIIGRNILFFSEIDSTNNYLKSYASQYEDVEDGLVVISDIQNDGRGRMGRRWDSQAGKGIWMSILLKPSLLPYKVQIVTLGAAVAVVRALEKAFSLQAGIKWPNDIILNEKKVCGILTEMSAELDRVNYVVLGIGINVNHIKEDFEEQLREKAISLKEAMGVEEDINRVKLVQILLSELEGIYRCIKNEEYISIINEWKKYSITLGRDLVITKGEEASYGKAIDILDDGRLVVEFNDGHIEEIMSGEITVRGIMGYA